MNFKQRKLQTFLIATCSIGLVSLSISTSSIAQESLEANSEEDLSTGTLEEVVVTGARGKPRTVSDSPVPIDVFSSKEIDAVAFTDTNDILQTLVPSYSVSRQPISDGATFIRPASLRGLPTDKTLVLVNSKRRHRSSLVTIGGSGTQGPDIATIPAAAIKNIEILRDGAAAQYGSDAIAGVMNFILKDNSSGGSINVNTGEYFEGDGFQTTLSGNFGLPLGDSGFVSVSGELSTQDFTQRGEQYCQSWFCLDQSNPEYDPSAGYAVYTEDAAFLAAAENASLEGDVVQPWGQPNSEAARMFFNAGYELQSGANLYAHGNYSESEGDGSFFYRYPGNGTIEDLRLADGSVYSPLEIFPGGFTPRFTGEVSDYSLVTGIQGDFGRSTSYDFSARYGFSEVSYTLANTINPSLGPDSPTSFRPGDLSNEEIQLQADFATEFELGDKSMVLAYGVSYLEESYEVVEGEEASYAPGPFSVSDPFGLCNDDASASAAGMTAIAAGSSLDCADSSDPVYRVVGVGSNGFPGFSPEFSDTYTRDSQAVYADLSTDISDDFFVQAALRYESYSDFDDEVVGKVAAKYNLNDVFSVRGSFGTGFRAPTPGQQGTTNVSTRLPNGLPVATGLFPASSSVAQALGASDLKPETSTNYTFGVTANFEKLGLTVDFYQIDLKDRTYAISTLDVSTDPSTGSDYANFLALQAAGVAGAESIGGVFYFANAFDSKTSGVDVVATYPIEWASGSTTNLAASINYNKSEFSSDPSEFLNEEDQFDFENNEPDWRTVITASHDFGQFSVLGRANVYGSYENFNAGQVQKFSPIALVDLEGTYHINDSVSVSIGGRNVTDEYPELDEIGDFCCGRTYSSATAVSWQGGYYYLKLNAAF